MSKPPTTTIIEEKKDQIKTEKNKILSLIDRNVFEYEISKYLMPYERFLLSSTCKFMSNIFNISSFKFDLHLSSDLSLLKPIITKYFGSNTRRRGGFRQRFSSNCIDLSNNKYSKLTKHDKLSIKYLLIFLQKLGAEYFPLSSFQHFLDISIKLTFTNNDSKYADEIFKFLSDIIVHENSNIGQLINNLHLNNMGMNSHNHLNVLSNNLLPYCMNIKYLYLDNNMLINDGYIRDLFLCIAANNHQLQILDISNTSITNESCQIIYDFCLSIYKINNQSYHSSNSSDNDNDIDIHDRNQLLQSQSQDDNDQELIYMSSEDDDDDGDDNDNKPVDLPDVNDDASESDLVFSTDDEFDNIVTIVKTLDAKAIDNDNDNTDNTDTVYDKNINNNGNGDIIVDPQQIVNDANDVNDVNDNIMQISISLNWIELKNNKGITSDGIDKLNQIYVKKLEPVRNFVLSIEGCSYLETNPNWDLSLL